MLNVIPHGTATKRTASGLTTPGQPLTDYSQDKYYDQGHDKLERQHDALKETQQHASDARANQDHRVFGHIRADMAEGRANRQGAAYAGDKAKFMKTYGDHVHGNAELYLSQGDPRVDDAVTLKATMTSHCSKHPIWKVWDCLTNRWIPPLGKGQELEFVGPEFPMHALPPPVIPASYLQSHSILPAWVPGEKAYWLKGIEPRRYKIHVVWSGSVKIGATLFDLYGEKNFLNALPGYISEVIQKITDVGITLRAGLKAELNGKAEWTQAPESTEVKVSGAVELAGILYVTVRFDAMLRVANEDVLGGHAHGTTTFSVKGELGFEPKEGHMHMPLDITAQWEKPLELNFLFVYIFGKKSMTYSFLEGHFPPLHICQVDLMGQG